MYFLMTLSRITHVEEDYCHKTASNLAAAQHWQTVFQKSGDDEERIPRFIGHSDSKEVSSSPSLSREMRAKAGKKFYSPLDSRKLAGGGKNGRRKVGKAINGPAVCRI